MMLKNWSAPVEAFVDAAHDVARRGLVQCSSGNLSLRLDADHFLATVSRSWMARLTAQDVALCQLGDGAALNGCTPSVEVRFHAGILRERPDVNAVLHFQSPAATVVACMPPETVSFNMIPEIPYYIGRVATVPFIMPGSPELADAVITAACSCDLLVLQNHGQVVVGATLDDVIQKAVFFELACQVIVQGGSRVRDLPEQAVRELAQAGREADSPA